MRNFDVNYIVNEEKGIVVCIISDCECNAIALIDSTTNSMIPGFPMPDTFFMSDKYKGIAKCSNEDTFDIEYGKKLAYRKAYLKYATALEKKVRYIAKTHEEYRKEMAVKFDKAVSKVDCLSAKADKAYQKILGEAE